MNKPLKLTLIQILTTTRRYTQSTCKNTPKKWKDLAININQQRPREKLIPLHDQNDKYLGIYTRKEAEKMARNLDLKLVCMENTEKRIYHKFISGLELHHERMKEREIKKDKDIFKDEKLLTISDKITTHDLTTRIKAVKKWLLKNHKVQIIIEISQTNKSNVEEIQQSLKDGVIDLGKVEIAKSKATRTLINIIPIKVDNPGLNED